MLKVPEGSSERKATWPTQNLVKPRETRTKSNANTNPLKCLLQQVVRSSQTKCCVWLQRHSTRSDLELESTLPLKGLYFHVNVAPLAWTPAQEHQSDGLVYAKTDYTARVSDWIEPNYCIDLRLKPRRAAFFTTLPKYRWPAELAQVAWKKTTAKKQPDTHNLRGRPLEPEPVQSSDNVKDLVRSQYRRA